jgi:hypothetical protein
MVLIIKKLVPVYSDKKDVPKRFKNLRKSKYVATFKYWYPNIQEILVKEYGLKPDEKILVFSMKEISLPHFNRYRTKFKKVYFGTLGNFTKFLNNLRIKIKSNSDLNKEN